MTEPKVRYRKGLTLTYMGLKIPVDLVEKIAAQAAVEGTTRSDVVTRILCGQAPPLPSSPTP